MSRPAAAITIELCAAVIQLAASAWVVRRTFQGLGTKRLPYGILGIPEQKWIPTTYCLLQAVVHVLKAGNYMDSQSLFSLISVPYVDYVLTCPMILADMFLAMRMQGVLLATSLCLSSLICAVMTFQTAGEARGLIFGLGFFLFVALFTHVFMQMRKKLPQLPAISKKPLYTAMGMFFGMWPLFPILWIFGPAGMAVIPLETYSLLHAGLDVACKSIFAVALQSFRLCMEDTGIFYHYTLLNPEFKAVVQANINEKLKQ